MADRPNRRELVGAGLALAGGGLAATALTGAVARGAQASGDDEILAKVLRLETLMVYCYERVLAAGMAGPQARRVIARALGHERAHVSALERQLARRGGAPQMRWSPASADRELARHHVGPRLTELASQHQSIRLLVDVESMAEGAWFGALGKLADPALTALGASIMACEAQHWTVLSNLSHPGDVKKTVPYAFVRGSSGY